MSDQVPIPFHYFLFHKPYGVLSQFTPEAGHASLRDFGPFPKDVYPVGRLDADSEGLLLLTNDNNVAHRLTTPRFQHPRTYLVQVEGTPTASALERLRAGIMIQDKRTLPAEVLLLEFEPRLPPRSVPIRYRASIPTGWLEITLREGRNRQVRKMTAAVGLPALRLVRIGIGKLTLGELQPGEVRHLKNVEIAELMVTVGMNQMVQKHNTPR